MSQASTTAPTDDTTVDAMDDLFEFMARYPDVTLEAAHGVIKCINPKVTLDEFSGALSAH